MKTAFPIPAPRREIIRSSACYTASFRKWRRSFLLSHEARVIEVLERFRHRKDRRLLVYVHDPGDRYLPLLVEYARYLEYLSECDNLIVMDTTQKRAAETAALFASAVPVSVRIPWRADSCEAGAIMLHCDRYPLNRWSDRFRDAFRVVLSAVLRAPSGSFAILQGDIRRPGGFRNEFLEANAKGPEAGFLTLDLAVESDYHPPRRRVPLGVLPLPLPVKISMQECYEAVDRPEWHNIWALNHPQYGPELMRRRWHAATVEYRRRRILAIAKNTSDYQEARRRYVKTLPRDPVIFPLNIPLLPAGSAIMLGVPDPSGARARRASASSKMSSPFRLRPPRAGRSRSRRLDTARDGDSPGFSAPSATRAVLLDAGYSVIHDAGPVRHVRNTASEICSTILVGAVS